MCVKSPLDCISLVHLKRKFFTPLVASSLLQPVVVGSHEDRANHPFFALIGLAAQRQRSAAEG
jgi:hypothetical protein